MERGSDRLAWSCPGTRPEPELAKGQCPQQIDVYSRHQLLGTATSNCSTGLGPQAAGGGLGDQGRGGEWGRKRRTGRQVWGGSPPQGLWLQSFYKPIHLQCHPWDQKSETGRVLHGDHRDRKARAKAAASWAGTTVQDVSASKI